MSIPISMENIGRQETGRLVSVLTRQLGIEYLKYAEDAVQDALLEAIRLWPEKGIPDNPPAWLFRVAKNKAINVLKRKKSQSRYVQEFIRQQETKTSHVMDPPFPASETEILDDQLRLAFTCCHEVISPDSQIALALRTLAGFSIPEIAKAFLTTEENIHKRLVRARKSIREAGVRLEMPEGPALESRLNTVLGTIYLLFNEGYSASHGDELIRSELCLEAIRLAELIESSPTFKHKSNLYGLLALMQFNAARFSARMDSSGFPLTLADQDRSLWDRPLIEKGLSNLARAMSQPMASSYQILAAISGCHCMAPDYNATDWKTIFALYDLLVQIDHSPLTWFNRAIALAKVEGAETALKALEYIRLEPAMVNYPLFYASIAEFQMELGRYELAISNYEAAIQYTSSKVEKNYWERRIIRCQKNIF